MGSFSQIEPPASWQLGLSVVVATFLSHQGKALKAASVFLPLPF